MKNASGNRRGWFSGRAVAMAVVIPAMVTATAVLTEPQVMTLIQVIAAQLHGHLPVSTD